MIGRRAQLVVAAGLIALVAWWLPTVRRAYIAHVVSTDAPPGAAPVLPAPPDAAAGLSPAPFVRVVLVDGLNREDTARLPAWNALCARGLDLEVDVGFPTVSLPVQVALWTGLTQQQSGVLFHSGKPLADPLGPRGLPAQVPGSIAIAETHPYIVHSLGFAVTQPPLGDGKTGPPGWDTRWLEEARLAVTGPARLVFVHVLRVDNAGHKKRADGGGRPGPLWRSAVETSDQILGELVALGDAAHLDTRWFLLVDHGHVPGGGHGGEERAIRRVRACVAGPGITPARRGPIALVDLSRALFDSLGVAPPPRSAGRPLAGALAAPLAGDELLPRVSTGRAVMALLLLALGALVTALALGRRAALWGPWWWPLALLAVLVALGEPTLSTPYIYPPKGDAIAGPARWGTYLAVVWVAAAVLLAERPGWRVALAQVALPIAFVLAGLALSGGLPVLWGDAAAPVVPRWTAWTSVAFVITARGLGAVALALLATSVLPGSGRAAPSGTRRSGS